MRPVIVRLLPGVLAMLAPAASATADPVAADDRGAPSARADSPIVAELAVEAPATCATREQLAARVLARAPRIRFSESGAATALRATLTPAPDGSITSELAVVPAGGRRTTRRLTASTCAEAVDALALVIAITLDPTYIADTTAPSGGGGPPALGSPPEPPPPERPAQASRSRPVERAAPPATVAEVPPPGPAIPHYGAGATAGAWLGPAPRAMLAFGGYASFALDRSSVWSPAVVLSAAHAFANDLVETGGVADLTLDALTLDACPLRLPLSVLEARACAAGVAGRLTASGSDTYSGMSYNRPFAAVGASARLSAAVVRYLTLSARFGATASLIRDAFEFSPEVFHRVASVTLEMELSVGLRFP